MKYCGYRILPLTNTLNTDKSYQLGHWYTREDSITAGLIDVGVFEPWQEAEDYQKEWERKQDRDK